MPRVRPHGGGAARPAHVDGKQIAVHRVRLVLLEPGKVKQQIVRLGTRKHLGSVETALRFARRIAGSLLAACRGQQRQRGVRKVAGTARGVRELHKLLGGLRMVRLAQKAPGGRWRHGTRRQCRARRGYATASVRTCAVSP